MNRILPFALLTLTACTSLGPDYQKPEVNWLENWQPDLYGQLADEPQKANNKLSRWWQQFDDPVLNSLIETAQKNNPSLQIAGLRVIENIALLGVAKSSLYPQAQQVSAGATHIKSKQHGASSSSGRQNITNYQAGLGIGWELDRRKMCPS